MGAELHESWIKYIEPEFSMDYMLNLKHFLTLRKESGAVIYPKGCEYFNALNTTPYPNVKIVILGQDPYHGPNQAHGLSFSVRKGVRIPPSLKNMYKELEMSLGIKPAKHGCLQYWAEQGVLLLNSVLTVEEGQAAAHAGKGWEQFTDAVIKALNEREEPIVFMLWGAYAQKKGRVIDTNKHLVLTAPHPSPLSAHRGFLGCGHFKQANDFLLAHDQKPIDWQLPD